MNIGYRSGFGYDIHGLLINPQRQLTVGGVTVQEGVCAQAHSDGDVLIHSLIDAILGALGLGDIGEHFPDTDSQYRNISSLILLEQVVNLAQKHRASIINVDSTVILQEIKLSSHKEKIRSKLAEVLQIPTERINVKAKTKENMDATGRGEAIEAYSAVLIYVDKTE